MRNGAREALNNEWLFKRSLIIVPTFILSLIIIVLIYNSMLHKTKVATFDSYLSLKHTDNTYAQIELDESDEPTYSTTDAAKRFKEANALLIGDSTAEGLCAYQLLNSENVVWTRGRIVRDIDQDLNKFPTSYTPQYVFFAFGANDMVNWQGDTDGFISSYKDAIALIKKKYPKVKICINSIIPVSESAIAKNNDFKYVDEFNTALQKLCKDNNYTFIDNRDLLKQAKNGKIYESDGIHPKYFYYPLWADNMVEVSGI